MPLILPPGAGERLTTTTIAMMQMQSAILQVFSNASDKGVQLLYAPLHRFVASLCDGSIGAFDSPCFLLQMLCEQSYVL